MTVNRVVELVITVYKYRKWSPIGGDSTEIPIPARAQRGIEDASECRESGTSTYPDADVGCSMIVFYHPFM